MLIAAFDYHWWVGAVAVTGIVLAAVYVLWMYQRTDDRPAARRSGACCPTSTGASSAPSPR